VAKSGLSAPRLNHMRDVLTGYVERGEVPGLVALVARRGEVHVDAIGAARDAIFRIASMTKPATAAAAMILVEEGLVRLDDPVDPLLPELAERRVLRSLEGPVEDTVPATRSITVRDLLTFTLGTGLVFAMPGTYPIQAALDAIGIGLPRRIGNEWMRQLGSLPLVYQPGDRWMYNIGSEVLSVLIARVSGRPLGAFMRERIFEPLGMRDTDFWVPNAKTTRLVDSYELDAQTGKLVLYDSPADSKWSEPHDFPSGAGGLVSTADDFLRFGLMMLNKGTLDGARVLSRPSIETMTMDHLTPEQKARSPWVPGFFDTHGWGFGLSVVTRRYELASTPGKFGWDGGLGTSWYCDPAEEMVTILLTQVGFTSPVPPKVHRDFWNLAYAAVDD
jgi:CubicO group peptidase (beta-lactamase class C family)